VRPPGRLDSRRCGRSGRRARDLFVYAASSLLVFGHCGSAAAQTTQPGDNGLTVEDAVSYALTHYPQVRAALAQVEAARAGVNLAGTNYLPRLDLFWQGNRGTRNNITGPLLPQGVIPQMSGPVFPDTTARSAFGSAAGMLFSWEPFDFGYRRATVNAAMATQTRVAQEVELTKFDVATATVDAFLRVLAAAEQVHTAEADVTRRQVLAQSIHVLVQNQLRAGADASRADAELAAARTRLIEAETADRVARAGLAQLLGIGVNDLKVEPGPLFGSPPEGAPPTRSLSGHPIAAAEKARADEASARVRALDVSYVPRFNLQLAAWGRGSGAQPNGDFAGGLSGLDLTRANWAVGLSVAFPLLDFVSIRDRKDIELARVRSHQFQYDQDLQDLVGQIEKARAALEGSRRAAQNTPIELQAARDAETQARARYQAGLGTLVEVADAQRLLAEAEITDALARLTIWRDLARFAAAQGDLEPFLRLTHPGP
jgi:outer membrane protein